MALETGPANPREEKIRILIVDDDPESVLALSAVLNDPSYEILVAENPDDALRTLLKNDLALILLDVYMKEMSGYELAKMIKSRPKTSQVPIIFTSAISRDQESLEKAYSSGALDFIQKPLDPAIVRAKVGVFVDLYKKSRQVRVQEKMIEVEENRARENDLERLHTAEQKRFQDLVEGVEHGFVWSADPDTFTFSYVSPRAELLLGYPLEAWKKQKGFWLNHVHPEDREAVSQAFRNAKMGKDLGVEHRFITADGDTLWFHTGVRLARKGSGAGVELRGLSIDMTYQKTIELGLSHALEARDEFLSIASHELRTPLTPLLLQLQSLERAIASGTELTSDRLSKTIEMWRRQVDRLAKLIDELLDVSRISAGKLALHQQEVDLGALVGDVLEKFKTSLSKAGCEARLERKGDLVGHWDRSKIEQVFTNLLSNAMKYAPGNPIDITLDGSEDPVSLAIRDHGIGISEDNQKRIFERFERAKETQSVSGLGLGLYICRKIIEAHGGRIHVRSEPGDGAEFTVTLPRRSKTSEQVA